MPSQMVYPQLWIDLARSRLVLDKIDSSRCRRLHIKTFMFKIIYTYKNAEEYVAISFLR